MTRSGVGAPGAPASPAAPLPAGEVSGPPGDMSGPPDAEAAPDEPVDVDPAPGDRGRPLSTVLAALVGLWGLMIGLGRLRDNSFFTHLETGRLILEDGRIPTVDPYSFTANGRPWIVQSWLSSVLFTVLDRIGGLDAVRLAIGLTCCGLALLVWRLSRPARSVLGRVLVVALVLAIGTEMWVERPLLFGLVFLAVVLVAAEGGLDPRWLVPLMWVWVNSHGSFPLAGLALVAIAAGRRLDGEHPTVELRALFWCVVGIAAASLNPLGPRIVAFPVGMITRTGSFEGIVEWQPPKFETFGQQLFLLQLFVAVLLLVRRPSYRAALPLAGFGLMALLSARNVAPASLVLLPGMALAVGRVGSLDGRVRARFFTMATAAIVVLALPLSLLGLSGSPANLEGYPVAAVDWLDGKGRIDLETRIVAPDFAGNYLEVRYGPDEVRVFIDDRVDMYPLAVIEDYTALLHGERQWRSILERYDADVVIWADDQPLTALMVASPEWRLVYRDDDWVVAVPQDSPLRADR